MNKKHPASARCFFYALKGVLLLYTNRDKRIQQIKDCGQTIIDKAEEIYGDFECPTSLRIIITMESNEVPTINVDRQFYSRLMLDNL